MYDTKQPTPVDAHVGGNLRTIRRAHKLTQEKLGDALGLTFQQVQKYEKGVNRISVSRLYQIAQFFDLPLESFFEGLDMPGTPDAGLSPAAARHQDLSSLVENFLTRCERFGITPSSKEPADA